MSGRNHQERDPFYARIRAGLDLLNREIEHRYLHMQDAGLEEDDDEQLLHLYDGCARCRAVPLHQTRFSTCTATAALLAQAFEGAVYGYRHEDNPEAELGATEYGHDFAILGGGRYLADWWAKSYYDVDDLYDLRNPEHLARVRVLYGPRARWQLTQARPDPAPYFHDRARHGPCLSLDAEEGAGPRRRSRARGLAR